MSVAVQGEKQQLQHSGTHSTDLVSNCFLGREVKGVNNGVVLAYLQMQLPKLGVSTVDIPFLIANTDIDLKRKKQRVNKSQSDSNLSLNVYRNRHDLYLFIQNNLSHAIIHQTISP